MPYLLPELKWAFQENISEEKMRSKALKSVDYYYSNVKTFLTNMLFFNIHEKFTSILRLRKLYGVQN